MSNQFQAGAKVYVDGKHAAVVRDAYPKGSASYMFPHYRVDYCGGDRNVAVAWDRVGVGTIAAKHVVGVDLAVGSKDETSVVLVTKYLDGSMVVSGYEPSIDEVVD